MVHALKEVWRALDNNGAFLDLRPTPLHREIAIVTPRAVHIAGLVDTAATVADKRAANAALKQIVQAAGSRSKIAAHLTFSNI
jgi:hypothetical protein